MKREIAAFILGPIVLLVIVFLPAWVFLAALAVVTVIAADELIGMARAAGIPSLRLPLLLLVVVLPVCGWWLGESAALIAVLASMLLVPSLQLSHPQRPAGALTGTAVGLLTVIYLGLTCTCLGWLRLWPAGSLGPRLVVFFLVAIWLGDSGAYYVGKNLGRHRMSPRISPKKTWEGLIACVVTTMAAAAVMKLLFLDLDWLHILALGAILGLAGPLGDLVESQLKRDTGVKDSSTLIPGHGGLLDRTDSLFFAAPPVLGYLLLVGIISHP